MRQGSDYWNNSIEENRQEESNCDKVDYIKKMINLKTIT